MWMMLQQNIPDDYVISTGVTHSVRDFAEAAVKLIGWGKLEWRGSGLDEVGVIRNQVIFTVDPTYYRPAEVDYLRGDSTKALNKLGWKPETSFEDMVDEMIYCDKERIR
jgi:GDPmannose 4,6-dehydratase